LFVLPQTRGSGCGIALAKNRGSPLQSQIMVSHAWAEDVQECGDAIASFFKRKSIPADTPLWFCTFSQYQPGDEAGDIGPTISEQIGLDPFKKVICSHGVRNGYGMIVIQTTKAELYSRLWCVYEIGEALENEVRVEPACSDAYAEQVMAQFRVRRESAWAAQTSCARCSSAADEKMIRINVCVKGGFDRLDKVIEDFRYGMLKAYSRDADIVTHDDLVCHRILHGDA